MPQGFDIDAEVASRKLNAPPVPLSQQNVERKANMDVKGDIPPSSPLAPPAPAWQRFAQGYGLPSTMKELNALLQNPESMNPVSNAVQSPSVETLFNLLGGPVAPILSNAAHIPADVAGGNLAGAMGRGAQLGTAASAFMPRASAAAGTVGRVAKAGGAGLGHGVLDTLLESRPLGVQLPLKGIVEWAKKSWQASAPPTPTAFGTLAETDPSQLPAIPGATRAPMPSSPPPYQPKPPIEEAAFGNAPNQTGGPLGIAPRKMPSGTFTKENFPSSIEAQPQTPLDYTKGYIDRSQAKAGTTLAVSEDGQTWTQVTAINPDGRGGQIATVVTRTKMGKQTEEYLPVRVGPKAPPIPKPSK